MSHATNQEQGAHNAAIRGAVYALTAAAQAAVSALQRKQSNLLANSGNISKSGMDERADRAATLRAQHETSRNTAIEEHKETDTFHHDISTCLGSDLEVHLPASHSNHMETVLAQHDFARQQLLCTESDSDDIDVEHDDNQHAAEIPSFGLGAFPSVPEVHVALPRHPSGTQLLQAEQDLRAHLRNVTARRKALQLAAAAERADARDEHRTRAAAAEQHRREGWIQQLSGHPGAARSAIAQAAAKAASERTQRMHGARARSASPLRSPGVRQTQSFRSRAGAAAVDFVPGIVGPVRQQQLGGSVPPKSLQQQLSPRASPSRSSPPRTARSPPAARASTPPDRAYQAEADEWATTATAPVQSTPTRRDAWLQLFTPARAGSTGRRRGNGNGNAPWSAGRLNKQLQPQFDKRLLPLHVALRRAESQPRLHDKVLRSTSSRRARGGEAQLPMQHEYRWPHSQHAQSAASGYDVHLHLPSGHGESDAPRALFRAAQAPHPAGAAPRLAFKHAAAPASDMIMESPAGVPSSDTRNGSGKQLAVRPAAHGTAKDGDSPTNKSVRFGGGGDTHVEKHDAPTFDGPRAPAGSRRGGAPPPPEWSPTRPVARPSIAALLHGRGDAGYSPRSQAAIGPSAVAEQGKPLAALPRPAPIQTEPGQAEGPGQAHMPQTQQSLKPGLWGRFKGVFSAK